MRIQLLPASGGWAAWKRVPSKPQAVDLRYEDLPGSVDLAVPTLEGFAAMKLAAWEDRRAPRDLFDLAGLATQNAFTAGAADVFAELCGRPPDPRAYRQLPASTNDGWSTQLSHQARAVPAPAACLSLVSDAIDALRR